jgi:glycosyltransferase involved in cell wall biosynthesis
MNASDTPAVSLIVSVYNNVRLLSLIFDALDRQTFTNFEVIIADDGSGAPMAELIRARARSSRFPIVHCWHEDKGWRKNTILNAAVRASTSDYLIFIDGDCIPHRHFLEEHYAYRRLHTVIGGRRVQLTPELSRQLDSKPLQKGYLEKWGSFVLFVQGITGKVGNWENTLRITSPWLRKCLVKDKIRGILGCNFSLYKEDLLLVNGFDERFVHPGIGEDTDLDHRLKRAGIHCYGKKHLLTLFHIDHPKANVSHPDNIALLRENDAQHRIRTPFGIVRD